MTGLSVCILLVLPLWKPYYRSGNESGYCCYNSAQVLKHFWNWVMGKGWQRLETLARKCFSCCEPALRTILVRAYKTRAPSSSISDTSPLTLDFSAPELNERNICSLQITLSLVFCYSINKTLPSFIFSPTPTACYSIYFQVLM